MIESPITGIFRLTAKALRNQHKPARVPFRGSRFIQKKSVGTENLRNSPCWNDICKRQGKPRGLVPEGKAATMFEVTLITENANHKRYRVSLRSSSKRVPSNPSSNGVEWCPNKSETDITEDLRNILIKTGCVSPGDMGVPGSDRRTYRVL